MSDSATLNALSPTVLEWSRGLASLSPGQPPCPGFRPDEWAVIVSNARRFVDDFGMQAAELGWDNIMVFGCYRQHRIIRGNWTGVLLDGSR
ncbi:hypothetical protein [Methylobacterium nodulans]|uniref:Uncharacterized protein n=1 Tax=Methylobacterium nodulans (strain LMG 21967 / CNCM I-2342 / ORS 2060) TaxID=460265 RepID=B8IIG1_METNO|nr:hypothetical protein [Methylobacterium nodulans]ACL59838.1 conserved hypothetical protein [Methylobacterium nodulans ORS 2060]